MTALMTVDRLIHNLPVTQADLCVLRQTLQDIEDRDQRARWWTNLQDVPEEEKEAVNMLVGIGEQHRRKVPVQSLPRGSTPMQTFSVSWRRLLIQGSQDWMFDVWKLDSLGTSGSAQSGAMPVLLSFLCEDVQIFDALGVEPAKLQRFARLLQRAYRDVPYHNRMHACAVLLTMHHILILGEGIKLVPADRREVTLLACYLAALGHDADHPGLTNDYLVLVGADAALRYNDQSPNENTHAIRTLTLLHDSAVLSAFDRPSYLYVRQLLIQLILATDMKRHFSVINDADQAVTSETDGFASFLQLFIKCADLGHMALQRKTHREWVARLEEEYFLQGDLERAQGLPVSPLMDRHRPGIAASQRGFIKAIALPLFQRLKEILPKTFVLFDGVQRNLADA